MGFSIFLHHRDTHVPPEGHRPCREHVGARRYRDDVRTVQAESTRVPAHSADKEFLGVFIAAAEC